MIEWPKFMPPAPDWQTGAPTKQKSSALTKPAIGGQFFIGQRSTFVTPHNRLDHRSNIIIYPGPVNGSALALIRQFIDPRSGQGGNAVLADIQQQDRFTQLKRLRHHGGNPFGDDQIRAGKPCFKRTQPGINDVCTPAEQVGLIGAGQPSSRYPPALTLTGGSTCQIRSATSREGGLW